MTDLELDPDELKEYVQKGAHYTQEMQALRDKERNLTPYEALIRQLQSDPALSQHIADYFQRGKAAPKAEPQGNLDPIDLLKQEIKRETIQEMQQQFIQPIVHQTAMDRVLGQLRTDPEFSQVDKALTDYVLSQPETIRSDMARQIQTNPKAVVELYEWTKKNLLKPKQTTQETPIPDPVKKETKAPILETGGGTEPPAPTDAKKREKISKLKAKAIQSGNTEALGDWLLEMGGVDHLL
jgi:hypothetical protein